MLSKSQARAFFLGGTLLFSVVFLGLTVDTVRQTAARTNAQALDPVVLHGKQLWEHNNCMGCHTLLGEGGYYAPDLTKVVERRGEAWIGVFLDDPQAMFPGERKMVKYNFNSEEKAALVAFFRWVGNIDANGWPPAPSLAFSNLQPAAGAQPASAQAAPPEKYTQLCVACHAMAGKGGNVGPALDRVGAKFDAKYLDAWLRDPQAVKPGTNMPKLPLTDAERDALVAYLSALK